MYAPITQEELNPVLIAKNPSNERLLPPSDTVVDATLDAISNASSNKSWQVPTNPDTTNEIESGVNRPSWSTKYVRTLYDYNDDDPRSLRFGEGELVEVLNEADNGWLDGKIGKDRGWFPGNYCVELREPDVYTSSWQQSTNGAMELSKSEIQSNRRPPSFHVDQEHTPPPLQRAPSPPARDHSQRNIRQTNERFQQLENDLHNARKAARTERIANMLREVEIQHLRRDRELEGERIQLERKVFEARSEKERKTRNTERNRRLSIGIHQSRDDDLEDRGARVLRQATKYRHIRETGQGEPATGLIRRATVDGRRRQQSRHAGEDSRDRAKTFLTELSYDEKSQNNLENENKSDTRSLPSATADQGPSISSASIIPNSWVPRSELTKESFSHGVIKDPTYLTNDNFQILFQAQYSSDSIVRSSSSSVVSFTPLSKTQGVPGLTISRGLGFLANELHNIARLQQHLQRRKSVLLVSDHVKGDANGRQSRLAISPKMSSLAVLLLVLLYTALEEPFQSQGVESHPWFYRHGHGVRKDDWIMKNSLLSRNKIQYGQGNMLIEIVAVQDSFHKQSMDKMLLNTQEQQEKRMQLEEERTQNPLKARKRTKTGCLSM